jgi:6-pyruvoyltetrahydropterin/6-carboxytetrahydropterin synthase
MYEITIEKTFSAAHALRLPDGSLEPLHGHDWIVRVTVASGQLDAMDTVMDFHRIEDQLEAVVEPWRNRNLNEVAPFAGGEADARGLAVNPSAERVAEQVAWVISGGLPEPVWLRAVSVREAPNCWARYRP